MARQSDTPTAVGSDILHFLLLSDSEKLAQNRNGNFAITCTCIKQLAESELVNSLTSPCTVLNHV